jgi:curved DNA-binding protein CbpA
MELKTSFKILGIDPGADKAQAKHAYKAQVRRWHPDQFPEGSLSKAGAEEQLKQINIAYDRVNAHLAVVRPDPAVHVPPPYSPRGTPRRNDAPGEKPEKRSWVDHLFSTLNAFSGHDDGTPGHAPADETDTRRRKTFGQVLDEMAGGSMSAKPTRQSGGPTAVPRRTAAGNRRFHHRTTSGCRRWFGWPGSGQTGKPGPGNRPKPIRVNGPLFRRRYPSDRKELSKAAINRQTFSTDGR